MCNEVYRVDICADVNQFKTAGTAQLVVYCCETTGPIYSHSLLSPHTHSLRPSNIHLSLPQSSTLNYQAGELEISTR